MLKLRYSVLFCSVLFCSVLFCSVLFCSVLFCSVLFCSVLFCQASFCESYIDILRLHLCVNFYLISEKLCGRLRLNLQLYCYHIYRLYFYNTIRAYKCVYSLIIKLCEAGGGGGLIRAYLMKLLLVL